MHTSVLVVEMIPRASCAKSEWSADMRVITASRWGRPNQVKFKQIRVIYSSDKHTAGQSCMQAHWSEVSWHLDSWAKMDCCMCNQPCLVLVLNFNFTQKSGSIISCYVWNVLLSRLVYRDVFWQPDMDGFVLISLWTDGGGKRGLMLGDRWRKN